MSLEIRIAGIESHHEGLSIRQQCLLLGINRSSYYLEPKGEKEYNLELMKRIDKEYLLHPFYGSRRMTAVLKNEGHAVNRKRIQRLMQIMGLEAIYPKPHLSISQEVEIKYPYLLKNAVVNSSNMAWCSDITYIPLQDGFAYLVAILDWYSRYILSWRLSNSMDVGFCLEALEEAFEKGKPEIFNTDQGSQFTSFAFVNALLEKKIKVSWDGRGRAMDNIFVERLWRSLKYEEVYLKEYQGIKEARESISKYFDFYNNERPHQALRYQTPKLFHYN
jgi:putative transposase